MAGSHDSHGTSRDNDHKNKAITSDSGDEIPQGETDYETESEPNDQDNQPSMFVPRNPNPQISIRQMSREAQQKTLSNDFINEDSGEDSHGADIQISNHHNNGMRSGRASLKPGFGTPAPQSRPTYAMNHHGTGRHPTPGPISMESHHMILADRASVPYMVSKRNEAFNKMGTTRSNFSRNASKARAQPEESMTDEDEEMMSEDEDGGGGSVPVTQYGQFGTNYGPHEVHGNFSAASSANMAPNLGRGVVSAAPAHLLPSRDSGYKVHKRAINKVPQHVPTNSIPEASLRKRKLTRSSAPTMGKRAHGANDPENILIVNLVENNGLRWGQIADHLNNERIATGRAPSFTANSVHNRYNRNAPLMFAAEGKPFVPIKERGENYRQASTWTADLDLALVAAVEEIDAGRWNMIAETFNQATGMDIDGRAAAFRFGFI